ncbi:hypothetical protein IAU60_001456 [Kwoniella sp. DSM 27419]
MVDRASAKPQSVLNDPSTSTTAVTSGSRSPGRARAPSLSSLRIQISPQLIHPQLQPDVSPTCTTPSRQLEPVKTSSLEQGETRRVVAYDAAAQATSSGPAATAATTAPAPSTSHSPIASSSGGRRASLAYLKLPVFKHRDRDMGHSSGQGSAPSSPVTEFSESQLNMNAGSHGRPTSSNSRKGKEVYEMTTVSSSMDSPLHAAKSRMDGAVMMGPTKEEMALAKWRKWIVEQPVQPGSGDNSPLRSGRASPANSPLISKGTSHLSPSRRAGSPRHANPAIGGIEPHRSNSAESSGSSSSALANRAISPRTGSSRFGSIDYEIFNTESVLALRDVELAIDEELLEKAERERSGSRRMSTQPRLSESPNPFVDVAQRLASRRVRPIVLELIQALGHFVDAVWSQQCPDKPCPWVIRSEDSSTPASLRRMVSRRGLKTASDDQQIGGWKSPMITAVQKGKTTGHVRVPPTTKDVKFWGDEVTFAIRDVDEVVGIYKGVGWAFGSAMRDGHYGAVVQENVLGEKGDGGGMVRLLNDLEEAIWGDAPPRPTDLAYELPADFDPYALPDDADLLAAASSPRPGGGSGGGRASSLADFFGGSSHTPPPATPACGPLTEEAYTLPDLISTDPETVSEHEGELDSAVVSPTIAQGAGMARRGVIPGIEYEGAEEMTLEELGKKRHRDWLESRMAQGVTAW